MRIRTWGALAALGLGLPLGVALPAQAASPALPYDLDGDGYPELVVGAPGLTVGKVEAAGGVLVLRASKQGLTTDEQVITQASRGVPGAAEDGDTFGDAVASADFDRDGFADLAIGAPGETVGTEDGAGSVTVVRGSKAGLDLGTSRTITLAGSGRLGTALVAADLTGDGYPDLAVGSPGEGYVEGPDDADYAPVGVVHVLRGGPAGLSTADALLLSASRGSGGRGFDVGFGDKLATGRLDGDSTADLVVGSAGARFVDEGYPGSVSVCLGHQAGPTGCSQVLQDEHLANMDVVAVGRVTGSARPDVVVGTDTWSEEDTGRVNVLTLSAADAGVLSRRTEITQASPGVPGHADIDGFGAGLAVADLDHDGYADMVVGSPNEHEGRGRVTVVRGGPAGYATTGGYTYDQSSKGVPGRSEQGDLFGRAVTLVDHDADGRFDLTVGAPGENSDAGSVTTLRGAGKGFTTKGASSATLASLGHAHPRDALLGWTFGSPAGSGS